MRLNKQRTAYAVVLGLGLTALAVDRLFLGTGATDATATAAASSLDAYAASPDAPADPAASAAKAAPHQPGEGLEPARAVAAGRLRDWKGSADAEPVGDAFSMPPDWAIKPAEPEKPAQDSGAIEKEAREQFRLLGVMGGEAKGFMVVLERANPPAGQDKQRPVRVGDEWGDAKVVQADEQGATLEYRGVTVRLELPGKSK